MPIDDTQSESISELPDTQEPRPNQRVFPVAGLPRSGSTLLQNLLAQNPNHYVTPTSGLVDLIRLVRDSWSKNPTFQAEGVSRTEHRVAGALRGMVEGYYKEELSKDKCVFEKSRGWPPILDVLDTVFEEEYKIILTLRDIRAVLASFEMLYRKNPLKRHEFQGDAFFLAKTAEGRARVLLAPGSVVGVAISHVRDCIARGPASRVVAISYQQLTSHPAAVMKGLHQVLRLPEFKYDPDHVEQKTHEDDGLHGWGDLHTIRPYVEPPKVAPWLGLWSEDFSKEVAEAYSDIHKFL